MQLSQDTLQVIDFLNKYTNNSLRKSNDFGLILELGASNNLPDEILDLIFQGKIIWTLSQKIKKSTSNTEGLDLVQKEFELTLDKAKKILEVLVKFADAEDKERLETTYLNMTRGCLLNLIDLSHDLAKFKNMQIEGKK